MGRGREAGGSLRGNKRGVALIYISQDGDASACGSEIDGYMGVSEQQRASHSLARTSSCWRCGPKYNAEKLDDNLSTRRSRTAPHSRQFLSFSLYFYSLPSIEPPRKGPGSMLSLLSISRSFPSLSPGNQASFRLRCKHPCGFTIRCRRFFETTSRRKIVSLVTSVPPTTVEYLKLGVESVIESLFDGSPQVAVCL